MRDETKNTANSTECRPLRNIRVVDLSRLVSGNLLTHVLADLGATVIKLEPPVKGDELRAWKREGVSTYWLAYSRNKDMRGAKKAKGFERIYLPGEREYLSLLDHRKNGIPIGAELFKELKALAEQYGVPLDLVS